MRGTEANEDQNLHNIVRAKTVNLSAERRETLKQTLELLCLSDKHSNLS